MAAKTKTEAPATANGNKPVKVFKAKGIKVSVFANQVESDGKPNTFYKTATQKFYRDGEEWKTTQSLGRDDLPVAQLLLGRAWEWIIDRKRLNRRRNEIDPTESTGPIRLVRDVVLARLS